jgi:cell wall assembly regulator SMI1
MDLSAALEEWDRIEAVLLAKAPPIARSLLPGASLDELHRVEREIGCVLPDFVRAAYLRHNGQVYRGEGCHHFLMPSATWTPLATCLENWQMLASVEHELLAHSTSANDHHEWSAEDCAVRRVPWHAGHIPIGACDWDEYFFLDTAPGGKGTNGQLFTKSMEEDYSQIEPCGDSLQSYLLTLVDHLQQGRVVYDMQRGRLLDSLAGRPLIFMPMKSSR